MGASGARRPAPENRAGTDRPSVRFLNGRPVVRGAKELYSVLSVFSALRSGPRGSRDFHEPPQVASFLAGVFMPGFQTEGRAGERAGFRLCFLLFLAALVPGLARATTVIPVKDQELRARSDVVLHGVVVSTRVGEDAAGRPETI